MHQNNQISLSNYFCFLKAKSFIEPASMGLNLYRGYEIFSPNILNLICAKEFESFSSKSMSFFPVFYEFIENDLLKKIFIEDRSKYEFFIKIFQESDQKINGICEILSNDFEYLNDTINLLNSDNQEILKIFQNNEFIDFLKILQNQNALKIFQKSQIISSWAFYEDGKPDWNESIAWFKKNFIIFFDEFFEGEDEISQERIDEIISIIKSRCFFPKKIESFFFSIKESRDFSDLKALKEILENKDNIFDSIILFLENKNLNKEFFLKNKTIIEIVSNRQKFSYFFIVAQNFEKIQDLLKNQEFINLISNNEINLFFKKFPEFQIYIQNHHKDLIDVMGNEKILDFIEFSKENKVQDLLFLNFRILSKVFEEIGIQCISNCNTIHFDEKISLENSIENKLNEKKFNIENKSDLKKKDVIDFIKNFDNFFDLFQSFFLNSKNDIGNFYIFQNAILKHIDLFDIKKYDNLKEILVNIFFLARNELNEEMKNLKKKIIDFYQKSIFNHSPKKDGVGKILLSFFYDDREDVLEEAFRAYQIINPFPLEKEKFLQNIHYELERIIESHEDDLSEIIPFLSIK